MTSRQRKALERRLRDMLRGAFGFEPEWTMIADLGISGCGTAEWLRWVEAIRCVWGKAMNGNAFHLSVVYANWDSLDAAIETLEMCGVTPDMGV